MKKDILIGFMLIVVLLLGGCSKNDSKAPQQSNATPVAGGKVAEVFNVEKRPPGVPNFSWKDSTGATTNFDRFRGSVTLINFWATWCGPCKKELPDLVALSSELASKNVKFLGVSVDRAPNVIDLVSSYVTDHGISYQNLISNDDMEEAFGNPRAIPTSYLVDANGKIVQTIVGMRTKDYYQQAITALLH